MASPELSNSIERPVTSIQQGAQKSKEGKLKSRGRPRLPDSAEDKKERRLHRNAQRALENRKKLEFENLEANFQRLVALANSQGLLGLVQLATYGQEDAQKSKEGKLKSRRRPRLAGSAEDRKERRRIINKEAKIRFEDRKERIVANYRKDIKTLQELLGEDNNQQQKDVSTTEPVDNNPPQPTSVKSLKPLEEALYRDGLSFSELLEYYGGEENAQWSVQPGVQLPQQSELAPGLGYYGDRSIFSNPQLSGGSEVSLRGVPFPTWPDNREVWGIRRTTTEVVAKITQEVEIFPNQPQ
jgi:hypothetical protein